jgi:hypothetical protein
MAVTNNRYKCVTVSLLKRLSSGRFTSETATWIQKRFKISVGTSRKLPGRDGFSRRRRWANTPGFELERGGLTCTLHYGGHTSGLADGGHPAPGGRYALCCTLYGLRGDILYNIITSCLHYNIIHRGGGTRKGHKRGCREDASGINNSAQGRRIRHQQRN